MARKIVWSDPAVEDLEAAVEFIAKDSEAYAANLAQLTVDAAASLVAPWHWHEQAREGVEVGTANVSSASRVGLLRPGAMMESARAGANR